MAVSPLAALIRTGRAKLGISQRTLADRLGISQSAVAAWETGVVRPSLDRMAKLGGELGIELVDLVGAVSEGASDGS